MATKEKKIRTDHIKQLLGNRTIHKKSNHLITRLTPPKKKKKEKKEKKKEKKTKKKKKRKEKKRNIKKKKYKYKYKL